MSEVKTYNGWTNYETWAVKLWMDNEEPSYHYWREQTRLAWEMAGREDQLPKRFLSRTNRSENARWLLADRLKEDHGSSGNHAVFVVANGTVYADLLNAALSEVNWYEIANSLLEAAELEGYKEWDR